MSDTPRGASKFASEAAGALYDSPEHSIWLSHGSFVQWCDRAITAALEAQTAELAELRAFKANALKLTTQASIDHVSAKPQ